MANWGHIAASKRLSEQAKKVAATAEKLGDLLENLASGHFVSTSARIDHAANLYRELLQHLIGEDFDMSSNVELAQELFSEKYLKEVWG